MEQKIKDLITELKSENSERTSNINSPNCSDYSHTALVHSYNATLAVITKLEAIIK